MRRHIEAYLQARGVRYFRGHRDDEFFFLLGFVTSARRGRLTVHLGVDDTGPDSVGNGLDSVGTGLDSVVVTISPDRYYPVESADSLARVARRWNAQAPVMEALVHDSCDPRLVGVLARGSVHSVDVATLTEFVDTAVTAAIELFEGMAAAVPPAPKSVLRDAG